MAAAVPPLEKKYVKTKISELNAGIQLAEDRAKKQEEILDFIKIVENDPNFQLDPEFPAGSEWFNSGPLSFERELRGKIVILDFFTYCCINCMHVLPDLAELERKYTDVDGVVVVGVHSAKFNNEKISDNIKNAIMRYNITHPVINDLNIVLWDRLGVVCWPTLVIIGPEKQLLYYIIGEGHTEELVLFTETAVQYFRDAGRLSLDSVNISPARDSLLRTSVLRYPGKICVDGSGDHLYIADSSNNRVLVASRKTGAVEVVYGSGEGGLRDGKRGEAQFSSPQGLTWKEGALFVADTENHLIRKIDLCTHTVTTLTGTGCQGNDKEGGGKGRAQKISSPWDVTLGNVDGSSHPTLLFIAMAGTHQIWAHFLEDGKWLKGGEHPAGTTLRFSGSGEEANRNNSYPHKAAFAQPSGITLASDGNLYVADSESSSVRAVAVTSGAVKGVVGGAMDPQDLFAFGDVDGKRREARLQHPLGVAWNERDKKIYVADSYNHKIKVVNPVTKECITLAGTGNSGLTDGPFEHAQFSEPGGLCVGPEGRTLFVADTNNHTIRVLDLDTREVTQLKLTMEGVQTDAPRSFKRLTGKRACSVQCEGVGVPRRGEVRVGVCFTPPEGCHLTEGAPSAWQVLPADPDSPYSLLPDQPTSGSITELGGGEIQLSLCTDFSQDRTESALQVEVMMYFCEDSGVCHMQGAVLNIPLLCTDTASPSPSPSSITYIPSLPKPGVTSSDTAPLRFAM